MYARLQQKLLSDASPDPVDALFLQMSGRAYRRLPLLGRGLVFRESWWAIFLLVEGALAFRLGTYHQAGASNPLSIYTHWETPCLFFAMLFAGGWIQPSPWAAWLRNTARRGFLRDLLLSRMTGRDVLASHAAARLIPTHANGFVFIVFFGGYILGLSFSGYGTGRALSSVLMISEMMQMLIMITVLLTAMILKQANSYRLYAGYLGGGWREVLRLFGIRLMGLLFLTGGPALPLMIYARQIEHHTTLGLMLGALVLWYIVVFWFSLGIAKSDLPAVAPLWREMASRFVNETAGEPSPAKTDAA